MKKTISAILVAILLTITITPVKASAKTTPGEVDVPIIMYHSLLDRTTNEWNISPSAFEDDLSYLSENGYTAVHISDIIAYAYYGAPLPPKPIVLSFDDGYYNNYSQGMPLLEKYDKKITLAIIGSNTDHWTKHPDETDERYGHLTWPQISEMTATGRVELANHTNSLHKNEGGRKGCRIIEGENPEDYRRIISDDLEVLQTRIEEMGIPRPECFVYPFGAYCNQADEVLASMGFKATLSCEEGMNHLSVGDTSSLWRLKRSNRTPENSIQEILAGLED